MAAHHDSAAPEKRLLICCATTAISREAARRIRELASGPLDWRYISSAAAENSILPLFTRQLLSVARDPVPTPWAAHLERASLASAARSLQLTAELIKLLGEFRARGIQPIPYKGPVVGAQAYGEVALREFADLDFILSHKDVPAAHALLARLGYQPGFRLEAPAWGAGIPGEYTYADAARGILVELHTERTFRHFPVQPRWEEFAARLIPVSLAGHIVLTFCAEDALLMLCVHGAKDFWGRICWVADLAEMARSHAALDWPALASRAALLGVERMVSVGLLLADRVFAEVLPPEAVGRAREDRTAIQIADRFAANLLARSPRHWGAYGRFYYRRQLIPGARRGWAYASRLAFAPAEDDWSALRLPRALSPLYAALRPLRLARKYRSSPSAMDQNSH